ncbi:TRAP transporter substrate-binding protein DctP [Candidatus Bathyarchaeota archaeon]|nr:TRAP transporter substrate-binding protein DctP [Candidatus Bathyarchaeota archaeon]
MRKSLSVLVVVIIFISLFGILGNAANYQWKIQHIRPTETSVDKDVNWLVDQLKERSNGRIVIDIFPASQLGDYTVVQERVGLGDIEMQLACLGTAMDPGLMIQSLPYIVSNWQEASELYATGSPLIDVVADLLKKQNLKLISGWPCYFGGICLTKEPPSPADPDVPKNIKIRVPPQKSFELCAEALGYIATPIAWSEAFTSLQTGIVDGAIGAGAEGYYANFRDLAKYFLAVNDHFEMWYFYMNLDLWNSLSEEDKQLIQEVATELEKKRFTVAEEEEQANMQRLRDYGIEVITFTDEELAGFAKKNKDLVWPKIREDIGPEIMDAVLGQ